MGEQSEWTRLPGCRKVFCIYKNIPCIHKDNDIFQNGETSDDWLPIS